MVAIAEAAVDFTVADALRRFAPGLYAQLPPGVLKFDWVVNIKPVGNGQAVLKYLAPYVYRVAICDNRIVSVDEQGVTYRVKPSGKRVYKTRHLDGESFVRAFAQHILPPRFRKVRYYGFMSDNCGMKLADVMPRVSCTSRTGKSLASGDRARGLRGAGDNGAGKRFQRPTTARIKRFCIPTTAILATGQRSRRRKAARILPDSPPPSKQNPTGPLVDSGLLEQRI